MLNDQCGYSLVKGVTADSDTVLMKHLLMAIQRQTVSIMRR